MRENTTCFNCGQEPGKDETSCQHCLACPQCGGYSIDLLLVDEWSHECTCEEGCERKPLDVSIKYYLPF